VTGWDDDERPGRDFRPWRAGSSAGDDVVEQDARQLPVLPWRPPVIAVVLAAAGLLAGFAAGYAAGGWHARDSARVARSPAAAAGAPAGALTESVSQCSAQAGRTLQLGVQVTNQSAAAVTLLRVRPVLPLSGLKTTAEAWGPCGQLPAAGDTGGAALPAGASTWFTVTFRVLVKCPAALPVQFTLDYDQSGRAAAIRLPGFADLGHVPYPACRHSP
jgi:hypothetical protein